MPIVRIESSIPLPPQVQRGDALAEITTCIVQRLQVKTEQVRVALIDLELLSMSVAGHYGFGATPWIVAWVAVLEGRPPAAVEAFTADLIGLLARFYRVDEGAVRVLVQEYPPSHWGGVGRAATAAGS
jgi:phenylpyruvate tautomerase PptA (4-oxalocrotonate tautomerase family)